jgi:endosialidase-like protein
MNNTSRWTATLVFALSTVGSAAEAAQPPDVVQSDAYGNTAMGTDALFNQTAGYYYNTGAGYVALYLNNTGQYNTAFGTAALLENTASYNTAVGTFALELNGAGTNNTAVGYEALGQNTGGGENTAIGVQALYSNTGGIFNVAVGQGALQANQNGSSNTAIGETALLSSTGGGNIAIGEKAGIGLTTGNSNIYIGSTGANESDTIRIGGSVQTATYVAGIYGSQVTGSAVYVTSSGQLGVLASSERFKTDIKTMPELSSKLDNLRPVTFHYKNDPNGLLQYGLVAEEVAKVYPELVIRDDAGKIQGVHYEELAPMLLKELQQQHKTAANQAAEIRDLKQQLAGIQAAVMRLQPKDELLAKR